MILTLQQRIEQKIHPEPNSGCWIWLGTINPTGGYPQIWANGKTVYAHVLIYEMIKGPIPEGLQLDHLCRVRCCVNPHHLEPVTARENMNRGNPYFIRNRNKTHCIYGHEFTIANTIRGRGGRRECRECKRRVSVERYYRTYPNAGSRSYRKRSPYAPSC